MSSGGGDGGGRDVPGEVMVVVGDEMSPGGRDRELSHKWIHDAERTRSRGYATSPRYKWGGLSWSHGTSRPTRREYTEEDVVFICEFCLSYYGSARRFERHRGKCPLLIPPGNEIYYASQISASSRSTAAAFTMLSSLCT
ncbi:hypothetical protein BZA05DRAFT_407941 [Tricharina praecox]|uniref:uncharacterized protein n=1 Tax=Tricharina praecox TaxID=43433 RepID=UPI00221FF681|nr:uncharacterized protein BZA05DRAFT_407941 [Tricharina praecox]KAI5845521.1 hypothetical protein BZA05DRAFT_407941 [Tricharina praecox]